MFFMYFKQNNMEHHYLQHQYHTKIDDLIEKTSSSMTQGMCSKLISVLESVLGKLGRYDEGSLIGSILSFTVSSYKFNLEFICRYNH